VNRSISENSIFYKSTKMLSPLIYLTIAILSRTKKYFAFFCDSRMIGTVVITAVLVNSALICAMRIHTRPEWVFFRCLVVISFLPWLFCKEGLSAISENSKILNIFKKKNAQN